MDFTALNFDAFVGPIIGIVIILIIGAILAKLLKINIKFSKAGFEFLSSEQSSPDNVKLLLESLFQHQRNSLEKIRLTQEKITTLPAFHSWFYSEHRAYAASQSDPEDLPTELLESY